MEKEIIEYRGYEITTHYDEDAESPDSWGNDDMFLVYDHWQFYVEREGFDPDDIFEKMQEGKKLFEGQCSRWDSEKQKSYKVWTKYWFFPVYAYIHSGVALSLGRNEYPFNDRWDVSFKGFALIKRGAGWARKEDKAYEIAEGLIDTWNMYLSGQVYGYDSEVGSCWGFYGDESYKDMIEEAKSEIDYEIDRKIKEHYALRKIWMRNHVPLEKRIPNPYVNI